MSLHRIYAFCSLTGYLFVEQGVLQGKGGYWFANPNTRQRVFMTADEIEDGIKKGRRTATNVTNMPTSTSTSSVGT